MSENGAPVRIGVGFSNIRATDLHELYWKHHPQRKMERERQRIRAHPVTKYQSTANTPVCHLRVVVYAPQIAMAGVTVIAITLIHCISLRMFLNWIGGSGGTVARVCWT